MCGIVGFYNNDNDKDVVIKKMADRIKHRGPDGDGFYCDNNIALGHRRLSIIDIDGGSQPMFTQDKKLVVVFNGEIYNYRDLKETLQEAGYKFENNCDTEVLLHGYREWGEELPKKLRGMFAFALWDIDNKTLFCARDHFGIKPFYYYKKDGLESGFAFASEIKALLEYPKFEKKVNKKLIGPYLSFSFTPTNETLFDSVYKLLPGTSLTIKDGNMEIKTFYELEFNEKEYKFEDLVDEISRTMKDSVEHHMIADVEVGSFLSSGIDSSYMVSLARPDKTYTVGYDDPRYSEIDYAKDLADKLGISNVSKKITKEEWIGAIPKFFYHMDEPSSDPSAISLYFVSKLASKDVKVVLSGEGADEFFGGYNYYREEVDMKFYNKIPYPIRHFLAICFEALPEFKGRNFIVRRGKKIEDQYVGVNNIFSEKERKKLLNFEDTIKNRDITRPLMEKCKNGSDIVKMQMIDIRNWLLNDILLKCDRMTMASSIEGRTPFTDKEVFNLARTIPVEHKVTKDNTKVALREAARRDIPNEAYKKKKLGFPVPIREWMKEDEFYKEIRRAFEEEYVEEFFDRKYILKLLEDHKNCKRDNYKKVWIIYSFIKWYEIFFLGKDYDKISA
ncbi:MAG: asparagine synthase (glutamine-hydrolyzing) [Clostridia bacterium]|nr:asparagine synthase (glutamine-hydrolyzing) [Clostridia bacterium]